MKRIIVFLIFCLLIVDFPVFAVENIIVGYLNNNSFIKKPYSIGYEGLGFEYFESLKKYTNHQYTYNQTNDLYTALDNGHVHLIGPVFDDNINYLNTIALGDVDIFLATSCKDNELSDDSIIYINKDDVILKVIEDYLSKNDINAFISFDIDQFQYNSESFIVIDSIQQGLGLYCYDVLANLPFYFRTTTDNIELVDKLDDGILSIKQEDKYFYEKLYLKYQVFNDLQKDILNDIELIELQGQTFKVAYSKNYVPVSYIENNKPKGFAIDILNKISNEYGINFEYIVLDGGDIDWDINVSLLNDYSNENTYLSSVVYYDFAVFLIENNNRQNSEIPIYGSFDYMAYNQESIYEFIDMDNIRTFETIDELSNALYYGEIDYVVTTSLSTDLILKDPRISNYNIIPLEYSLALSLIFNEDIPASVVSSFKKIVDSISFFDIASIATNNSSSYELKPSLEGLIRQHAFAVITLGTTFLLVVFGSVFAIFYHKHKMTKYLLETDALTGSLSKHQFIKSVLKMLSSDLTNDFIIISIKIDQFSYLSEMNGYQVSKEIIREYYQLLKEVFDNALIARTIDDEFVILSKDYQLKNINISNLNYFNCLYKNQNIYSSLGVFKIKHGLSDVQYMIDCATSARNKGLSEFGNTIIYFNDEFKSKREIENMVLSKMEDALIDNEFKLYLQPKLKLKNEIIDSCEVLIRWHSKDDGLIFPNDFIPLFEKNKFIIDLDFYVIEEVFKLVENQIIVGMKFAINLSGYTILLDHFLIKINQLMSKYSINPNLIEFEITESMIISHYDMIKGKIKVLQGYGFYISIDDFGSGNSTLARLSELDVNCLKVDRLFLKNISIKQRSMIILENVVNLSKQLGLDVVVEGVESFEQYQLLKKLNVDYIQGFFYSKPLMVEDFIKFIRGDFND